MTGVLLGKGKLFIRKPGNFLVMTVLTLVFALAVGLGSSDTVNVPIYEADADVEDSIVGDLLAESDTFDFQWMSQAQAEKEIFNGKAEIGAEMQKDGFHLLKGVESEWKDPIEQTIERAYTKKIQFDRIMKTSDRDVKRSDMASLDEAGDNAVFAIETNDFHGEDAVVYDQMFQALFGFTLFFVIYTIAGNVFQILVEKEDGIWDRLILSPLKKWEIYIGNFAYSFLAGYVQILIIFGVFRYIVGIEFGGNFVRTLLVLLPYVFAIVALSILITGLAKTPQQFHVMISVIALVLAMIGGAFWPLEVVESDWLLALAKIDPVMYGLELVNGVAAYGKSFSDLLFPISVLFMMGVIMTGIGIHLMEKRHV